jgi:hypothetical protein
MRMLSKLLTLADHDGIIGALHAQQEVIRSIAEKCASLQSLRRFFSFCIQRWICQGDECIICFNSQQTGRLEQGIALFVAKRVSIRENRVRARHFNFCLMSFHFAFFLMHFVATVVKIMRNQECGMGNFFNRKDVSITLGRCVVVLFVHFCDAHYDLR